jgi:hypothetical protein
MVTYDGHGCGTGHGSNGAGSGSGDGTVSGDSPLMGENGHDLGDGKGSGFNYHLGDGAGVGRWGSASGGSRNVSSIDLAYGIDFKVEGTP